MEVVQQLVGLIGRGGEEPPAPLGACAQVRLFVASDDAVGLETASEYLPHVAVHRIRAGHRALLRRHGAREVAERMRMLSSDT